MSAEEDYSDLFENSKIQQPTHSQIVKQVINWFYGPDAGKLGKEWTKRLLRPRPRLTQALSTSTPEYVTYDTTHFPVHAPSARIPYHIIILGGVLILAVFYLLLFLVINRLRCCRKVIIQSVSFLEELNNFNIVYFRCSITSERLDGGTGRLGGNPMACIILKKMCSTAGLSFLPPKWVNHMIRRPRLMKMRCLPAAIATNRHQQLFPINSFTVGEPQSVYHGCVRYS
jgi:hypothetical protein